MPYLPYFSQKYKNNINVSPYTNYYVANRVVMVPEVVSLFAITGLAGPTKAINTLDNIRNTRKELLARRLDMFYRVMNHL